MNYTIDSVNEATKHSKCFTIESNNFDFLTSTLGERIDRDMPLLARQNQTGMNPHLRFEIRIEFTEFVVLRFGIFACGQLRRCSDLTDAKTAWSDASLGVPFTPSSRKRRK